MEEEEAFMYALELSLDSARRHEARDASTAVAKEFGSECAEYRDARSEAVAFGSVPPSTSRFDLTTYLRDRSKVAEDGRGQASGDEEGGDSRWITVPVTRSGGMDRTKAGADGYKMRAAPQSHPHLGSACDAVAGVAFEIDEYGRVRHFGVPGGGPAYSPSGERFPQPAARPVVASHSDPLPGAAHRIYNKGDARRRDAADEADEALRLPSQEEQEVLRMSESEERERVLRGEAADAAAREMNGGLSEEEAIDLLLRQSASSDADAAVHASSGWSGQDGAPGGGDARGQRDDHDFWPDTQSGLSDRTLMPSAGPSNLMDPRASRATPAVRTLAAPAETSMAMMSAPASRGRGGRRGGGVGRGRGRAGAVAGREREMAADVDAQGWRKGSEDETVSVVLALLDVDDAIKQCVVDLAQDANIASETDFWEAVGPLLTSCDRRHSESDVRDVVSQLWGVVRCASGERAGPLAYDQDEGSSGSPSRVRNGEHAHEIEVPGCDEAMSVLMGMGFSKQQAEEAFFRQSACDLSRAIEILLAS